MSDHGHFEIPQHMRSMAEASVEQVRKATEKFLTTAEQAADTIEQRGATMRAGARDIGARAFSFAEKNVQASLDYADGLAHARHLPEMMRLHGDYVQAQMRVLAEQAGEMSQIFGRTAMDAAKSQH